MSSLFNSTNWFWQILVDAIKVAKYIIIQGEFEVIAIKLLAKKATTMLIMVSVVGKGSIFGGVLGHRSCCDCRLQADEYLNRNPVLAEYICECIGEYFSVYL